jgi:signal transduction histidine kinase
MIFERFQQGDASDSRALGGPGLASRSADGLCSSTAARSGWKANRAKAAGFLFTLPAEKTEKAK